MKTDPENFQEVQNHYEFLLNPLLPRIQTLLSYEDFSQNPEEAAHILNITPDEFTKACGTAGVTGFDRKK